MMDARTEEIIKECRRQQESCTYTATALYFWLKEVRRYRVAFITVPIQEWFAIDGGENDTITAWRGLPAGTPRNPPATSRLPWH